MLFSSLPNLHPVLVHFPVALFSTAVGCDIALIVRFRRAWLDRAAALLYITAAISSGAAAISGKVAERSMAGRLEATALEFVGAHGNWAFFSVVLLFAVAFLRFDSVWRDRKTSGPTMHRLRLAAIGLAVFAQWVVLETAGRGGELVYRYGVGVEGR